MCSSSSSLVDCSLIIPSTCHPNPNPLPGQLPSGTDIAECWIQFWPGKGNRLLLEKTPDLVRISSVHQNLETGKLPQAAPMLTVLWIFHPVILAPPKVKLAPVISSWIHRVGRPLHLDHKLPHRGSLSCFRSRCTLQVDKGMVASFCMWLSSVRSPYLFFKSWPLDISSPQVVFCARLLRAACLAQQCTACLRHQVLEEELMCGTPSGCIHTLGEEARSGPSRKELPKTTGNLESVVVPFVLVSYFSGSFSAKMPLSTVEMSDSKEFPVNKHLKTIKMVSKWISSFTSFPVNMSTSRLPHWPIFGTQHKALVGPQKGHQLRWSPAQQGDPVSPIHAKMSCG